MFSLETVIMIGVIVLCAGGLLGAVISRAFIPPQKQKGLEASLEATREELSLYQKDVADHFGETSKLINNLTNSYKDVHDHLAKGAVRLTNAEISQQILDAGNPELGLETKDETLKVHMFEPPRDWAPKTPGSKGALSEEYGLDDLKDGKPIEAKTTQDLPEEEPADPKSTT